MVLVSWVLYGPLNMFYTKKGPAWFGGIIGDAHFGEQTE
jgi:hypothetical protein